MTTAVSTEQGHAAPSSNESTRAHLDVEVCTANGSLARLKVPPNVRLMDGGVASIRVRLRRLRPVGEHESPHFGANVILLGGEAIVAAITVDGERARVVMKAGSPLSHP